MISVIKADKKKEPFNEEKVIQSIKRAGIPDNLQGQVLEHIKSKLYDGISTEEIYRHVLEFLERSPHPFSRSRYSLKDAIMMLGPTGYPFEDFIARLLESQGYKTKVRQILNGRCITHEVDVIAEKDNRAAMIEAKFHNSAGTRSDVHVALYTKSRFEDIKIKNRLNEAWIVTNTKTTIDANTYAQCVGIKIMSWDYPEGESIRDLIEKTHLYPITMITSLSQNHKETLLANHIVLAKDLYTNQKFLDILPLSQEEKERVVTELSFLYNENAHS